MSYDREYGALGRIGVVTPQANPTVEPEVALLLPARVSMAVARCTSSGDSQQRLRDYLEQLGETLGQFDTLGLDAVGFACTGSSYLVDHDVERQLMQSLEERFGYPIISAAAAIDAALKTIGAQRIALACPYPQWLHEAAHQFWSGQGYDIVSTGSAQAAMGDTRSIYALHGDAAASAIGDIFRDVEADALVITGTGMPSLRLVAQLSEEHTVPVLSSNLCLVWQCLQRAGISAGEHAPAGPYPLLGGWGTNLSSL